MISQIIKDLYEEYKFKNILFVRTCTTGKWLDDIILNDKNDIERILYYTDNIRQPQNSHISTKIIHSNELENLLLSFEKTYDLICVDCWHEYDKAKKDFELLTSLLNDSGILISHDCYPWKKQVSSPFYIQGQWCGETYVAFTELSYKNQDIFFCNLNIDTGIGIASKIKFGNFLTNDIDRNKQEIFLEMHKNKEDVYEYFIKNSKEIINSISK